MTVPVVADIDFDLRRLPIHLSMMVAMIVDCIEAVRSPCELDVMVERATNLTVYADLVIELELELVPELCYQSKHHR